MYELVTDPDRLREIYRDLRSYSGFIAYDTESHGQLTEWQRVKKNRVVWDLTGRKAGLSFAYKDRACYIPTEHKGPNMPRDVALGFYRAFCALPNMIWGHHLDYDSRIVRNYAGEYLWPKNYGDTMILAWLVGAGIREIHGGNEVWFYGLKQLIKHYFNHDMITYEQCIGGRKVQIDGPTDDDINLAVQLWFVHLRKKSNKKDLPLEPTPYEEKRLGARRKGLMKSRTYRDANMADLTGEEVCEYACEDAFWTLQLATRFWPRLIDMKYEKQWFELEMPLLRVVREMHDTGVLVDSEYLTRLKEKHNPALLRMATEFRELTGADISSSQQCAEAFYNRMKIFPTDGAPRTKGGALAVDYDALLWARNKTKDNPIAQEVIERKIEYSALSKIITTYTNSLTEQLPFSPDGRVHPRFNMIGARTGRFSSSGPNFQNLPRPSKDLPDIRSAVIARPGYVMAAADYSQIEVILAAHYSKDAALAEIILEGKSMHDVTAAALNVDRSLAKGINFALQYGAGPKKLAQQLFIPLVKKINNDGEEIEVAPEVTQRYYDQYHELYSGVKAFRDDMADFAAKYGYVETIFGRRRYIPEVRECRTALKNLGYATDPYAKEKRKKLTLSLYHAERVCGNTPIQGSVADIMKKAMVEVHSYLSLHNPPGYLIAQVHDELLLELPEKYAELMLAKVVEIMQNITVLSFPITVSAKLGKSWADCK